MDTLCHVYWQIWSASHHPLMQSDIFYSLKSCPPNSQKCMILAEKWLMLLALSGKNIQVVTVILCCSANNRSEVVLVYKYYNIGVSKWLLPCLLHRYNTVLAKQLFAMSHLFVTGFMETDPNRTLETTILKISIHYNQPRIVSTRMKLTQKVVRFTVFNSFLSTSGCSQKFPPNNL